MIYHVYANQSNVGDWLSARGIQSLLAPCSVQELFCDEPFAQDTLATLAQAGTDDFIIIGGGGLFSDYFTGFWEGFRNLAAHLPFCLWGVGCCDLKRTPSRPPQKLIREIVQRSRFCSVRDALTQTFVGDGPVWTVPCPTLGAITPRGGQQARLLHVDHYEVVGPGVYEEMVATAQRFAHETGRSYRQTNNRIAPAKSHALAATLDLYASADLVLSSRLHGCIIALGLGRPVLAVSGDCKVDSFMAAAGLSQWVCDWTQINRLRERLTALPAQQTPWAFLQRARQDNRRIADAVRRLVPTTPTLAFS
jgi:polysaccharide pyruvyl transferase WcaK-like protein